MANKFEVFDPEQIYQGKTYSDLVSDWFNWFLTTEPDKHCLGPVVFLRSVKFPATNAKSVDIGTGSDPNVSTNLAMDPNYYREYDNTPNLRVGKEKLQIYLDQSLFIPVITAYSEASRPYVDWGLMQDFTGLTIDAGDDPPEVNQLTINGQPVIREGQMHRHRIVTPVFTVVVPDAEYGRSLKDSLETSLAPGHYPVIVEGYFALIRFTEPGTYYIWSWASAGREMSGTYFSESLYEVNVNVRPIPRIRGLGTAAGTRPPHKGALGFRPAVNEGIIMKTLHEKIKTGEISKSEISKLGKFFGLNLKNFGNGSNDRDTVD
jgi:hypothetical protein